MKTTKERIDELGLSVKVGDVLPVIGGAGMGWFAKGKVLLVSDYGICVSFTEPGGKVHEKCWFNKLTGQRQGDHDKPPIRLDLPEYIINHLKENSEAASEKANVEHISDERTYETLSK